MHFKTLKKYFLNNKTLIITLTIKHFFLGYRNDPVVYPTGLISTFVGTEVNGDQTTLHTTQRYRTFVDGSYTELLQSTSVIVPTPTLDHSSGIEATANVQRFGSLNSGKVCLDLKKKVSIPLYET